ncbi:hypothetical protein Q5H92_01690 [Hymenobacter sp. M29]|uniref:Outer membrane protein beta-barrel domain-containing protein n=1 Tax=Hymenobacter mellowenesis TaxID=3063995 RepID=A0ABT9A5D4_9BACT|nr:hypothetical protein [Hymenobacter sp. M29]MDO7845051.1 hypothetical protein [Hymenobacter sp. M29]
MSLLYPDFQGRGCRWGFLLGLVLAGPVAAQQPAAAPPRDSVADGPPCPPPAPAPRRVGFVFSLDNRESFLHSSAVSIIGLNAGVVLPGHRWRLGLGAYTLSRDYANLYTYQYKNGKRTKKIADVLTPQLSLTYLTPNISYVFTPRRWLEISFPLEAGLGRSHYSETDQNGRVTTESYGLFVPVEAGLSVLFKPTRWVGVSGSVGYRKSVFEVDYKDDFDGMYFSYRLNVFVGAIWRDWRRYRQTRHSAPDPAPAPRGN